MAAASLSANLCTTTTAILPCKKTRYSHSLQIRAQSYRDHHEGRSSHMVDSNLYQLKVRIEALKNKERLERCCLAEPGWNFAPVESFKSSKREEEIVQFLELVGLVGGTFGLTILSCTSCLVIISLVLHITQ